MRVKEKHETSVTLNSHWEWLYGEYVAFISENKFHYEYRTCKTGETFFVRKEAAEKLIETIPEPASIDESAVINFL